MTLGRCDSFKRGPVFVEFKPRLLRFVKHGAYDLRKNLAEKATYEMWDPAMRLSRRHAPKTPGTQRVVDIPVQAWIRLAHPRRFREPHHGDADSRAGSLSS